MENKSNSKNQQLTIDDIINEIKSKSKDGDYIFRGEHKNHCKISSALYREYSNDKNTHIDLEGFDLRAVQRGMLNVAKKHIGEPPQGLFENLVVGQSKKRFIESPEPRTIIDSDELEILTELQHYGGITNLIDFTTDYLIAIFFACAGELTEDGRVILLEKSERMEDEKIIRPQNPRHRVIAQKSIFLYPPEGFIDVPPDKIVCIPAQLKQSMQKYLRKHHDISAETIYNDIHGFIKNQKVHQEASKAFYLGLTFQYRAYHEEPGPEKQQGYKDAIVYYDRAIELNSEDGAAYHNRGECWLHLEEWEKALNDLLIALDMGVNIHIAFYRDYKGSAKEFKEKTGIQIPKLLYSVLGLLDEADL